MIEKPEPLIGYEVNELDQYPIIGEDEVRGIPLAVRNISGVTIYSRYGSNYCFFFQPDPWNEECSGWEFARWDKEDRVHYLSIAEDDTDRMILDNIRWAGL